MNTHTASPMIQHLICSQTQSYELGDAPGPIARCVTCGAKFIFEAGTPLVTRIATELPAHHQASIAITTIAKEA